ncbi:hypothetical protein TWF481_001529 [Arthrobotrys musiformis]|uniref:Uncharacterized protein n=1 Tax=Arthrobotrys musiformis TaxID=47236 RepID=A0AAV9WR23_9PEZI
MDVRNQMAWSMAVLAQYCEYLYQNGALEGESVRSTIKREGHQWWKRVFEDVIVVSDVLQCPSARLFIAHKKSIALKNRNSKERTVQQEALMILGCLDKFDWRLRAMIRNMTAPNAEKINFWNLLDRWEKMKSTSLRRCYETGLWWRHLSGIEPHGKSAMNLLHGVESSLWDQSKTIPTMVAFCQKFKESIFSLAEFRDIHLLLNRLDRVMAVVIYRASSNHIILKQSQLQYLQSNIILNQDRKKEYNISASNAATEGLNDIIEIYNFLWGIVPSCGRESWYKEAMCRRLDSNCVVAILNSRALNSMKGAPDFIQSFYQQARKRSFWVARQGAPNHQASLNVPVQNHGFFPWILEHVDVVQSKADPIIHTHLVPQSQKPKKFDTLLTIPFQLPSDSNSASWVEGIAEDQVVDDAISNEGVKTSGNETERSLQNKAACIIQRNWRICSGRLRNKRYIEQGPKHRRITGILDNPVSGTQSTSSPSRQCFRMVAFLLLSSIMESKSKLRAMTEKLENTARKKSTMEAIDKILGGHEVVRDYEQRITSIENSIESLGPVLDGEGISAIGKVVEAIQQFENLQEAVATTVSDFDNWIQSTGVRK